MNNGNRYRIDSNDLEHITCLTPGVYIVAEAREGGRRHDFTIQERYINNDLTDAVRMISNIVLKVNGWLAARKGGTAALLSVIGRRSSELRLIPELPASSRTTQNMAILGQDLLAVAYRVEGRNILKVEALRTMASGCRETLGFLNYIHQRLTDLDSKPFSNEKRELKQNLDEVRNKIGVAERYRHRIGNEPEISDEPIAQVLYPGGVDVKVPEIWKDYSSRIHENGKSLIMEARRSIVTYVTWLAENIVEVSLERSPSKYLLTPLAPADEGDRAEEIRVDDIVVLAGQYMIVAAPNDSFHSPDPPLIMTNYLRLTSIEEPYRTRRGRNRVQPVTSMINIFS